MSQRIYPYVKFGILLSLVFVLFGSVSHLAYTYNTIEKDNSGLVGWVLAFGIEMGLAWTAFGLKENKSIKGNEKEAKRLIQYIWLFSIINFFGNYYYSVSKDLEVLSFTFEQFKAVNIMNHLKFFMLSASLPIISLSLIDIYAIVSQKHDMNVDKKQRADRKTKKQESLKSQKMVVKPKSTNPRVKTTIRKQQPKKKDLQQLITGQGNSSS